MVRVVASRLAAALVLVTGAARAGSPPVHLEVEACDSLDADAIRRIFSADLGAPTAAELGPDVTEVSIGCEGESVVVRVKDPLSRKAVRRAFDPKSFGSQGESRLIAIAASELVLASWAELAANPNPKVPAEGAPAKPETIATAREVVQTRSAQQAGTLPARATANPRAEAAGDGDELAEDQPSPPRSPRRRTDEVPGVLASSRVTAVISFRSFLSGKGTLSGGGARVGQERFGVISWAADALVESGKLKDENVTSASVGGWLTFYAHSTHVTGRVGAGLRAGMLGLSGGPTLAAWGWPMLVGSVSFNGGPLVLELGGEGGLVDLLVRRSEGVRGVWASGQVGLGLVL